MVPFSLESMLMSYIGITVDCPCQQQQQVFNSHNPLQKNDKVDQAAVADVFLCH